MKACIQKLLDIAMAEVGYLEKASNSQLYDKTANAGYNNWTKYSEDLDNIAGFYNGKKNGFAWCTMFVDWCFVQAFGVENALKLLCQTMGDYGAGVQWSANVMMRAGRFYTSNPQPGDQIFFHNASASWAHTGLVYAVDSSRVYTVEGNTSAGNDVVVANGGAVALKSYALNNSRIAGYGRADWSIVEDVTAAQIYSGNRFLSQTEMQVNARYIYQYLKAKGWTLNAIAGMLGNMQEESTINPAIWQNLKAGNTALGFGLTQWTPASKYIDWCEQQGLVYTEMDSNLKRIEWELANGEQFYKTDSYPITFKAFSQSTESARWLACAFAWNYERSFTVLYGTEEQKEALRQRRGGYAEQWYSYLAAYGDEPVGGGGSVDYPTHPDEYVEYQPRKNMPFLLLMLSTRRR